MLMVYICIMMYNDVIGYCDDPIGFQTTRNKKRTSQWLLTRLLTLYDMATILVVILLFSWLVNDISHYCIWFWFDMWFVVSDMVFFFLGCREWQVKIPIIIGSYPRNHGRFFKGKSAQNQLICEFGNQSNAGCLEIAHHPRINWREHSKTRVSMGFLEYHFFNVKSSYFMTKSNCSWSNPFVLDV